MGTSLAQTPKTLIPHNHTHQRLKLHTHLNSPHSLKTLKALHAQTLKLGNDDVTLSRLLLCCSLSSSMDYALSVFLSIPSPSTFFYNSILKGYSHNKAHLPCLQLYSLMRSLSVPCDSLTFPPVLLSSGAARLVEPGEEIHGLAIKMGIAGNPILGTSLMDMYFACGAPDRALTVFETAPTRDVVFWNAAVARSGGFARARQLFDEMRERNTSSWNAMIGVYCKEGMIKEAEELFDEMPERDVVSWNTMMSGRFGKGDVDGACRLFDEMRERNVVSWNGMIGGLVQNRRFEAALDRFGEMVKSGVRPNEVTLVAVAQSCGHLSSVSQGKWLESYARRRRVRVDVQLAAALVDMYGKCGSVKDALRVFGEARGCGNGNTVLFSSMIEVLGSHGRAEEAFEVFRGMQEDGVEPNGVTFLGLLKACGHGGLVETGRGVWRVMKEEFRVEPDVEHYGAMVDLLGRAGCLVEAFELITKMPVPGAAVWSSLLSSCGVHGEVEMAEKVCICLEELGAMTAGNLVVLSKVYGMAGRLEAAAAVRRRMKEEGMDKEPGCSSIEIAGEMHEFLAGGGGQPRRGRV